MHLAKERSESWLDAGAHAESGSTRRIAIVAGGTAGHVYPALAVADEYRATVPGVEVLFLGAPVGFEADLVGRSSFQFRGIRASPLVGENLRGKARAIGNLVASCITARRMLKAGGFQMVLGFGSYACGGAILAARSLGLKTAIHESNTKAGAANRFLSPIVDRVYTGFQSAGCDFPPARALFTGNPVRADVLALLSEARQPPAAAQAVRILVTGGSLGSAFLNRRVPELLDRIAASGLRVEVRHQTGRGCGEEVRALYQHTRVNAAVSEYIEEMADAYRWAHFAITCAGAATMAELAVAGLPALLVPLRTAARNHQLPNATAFASQGGGWYEEEDSWRPEALAGRIAALLRDVDGWRAAASAIRRLARPWAAQAIVADCEALAAGSPQGRRIRPPSLEPPA